MTCPATDLVTFEDAQGLIRRDELLAAAIVRVAALNLESVLRTLVKERGWSIETGEDAESLYRKFLALSIRYPDRKLCPNGPTDEFWHAHILDTRKYAADCDLLFGSFLHHYPHFGMNGVEDRAALDSAFSETIDLFICHFGVDPAAGDNQARSCRPQSCP